MNDEEFLKQITQIIATQLKPIKTTQQEHTRILGEHTQILREHSRILGEHSSILGEHSSILGENTKDIKSLKGKVAKISRTLTVAIKFFDEGLGENRKKIGRIEDHLGISLKH